MQVLQMQVLQMQALQMQALQVQVLQVQVLQVQALQVQALQMPALAPNYRQPPLRRVDLPWLYSSLTLCVQASRVPVTWKETPPGMVYGAEVRITAADAATP
jgi:hypothetical protein